jgi:hypothetical protein
MERGWDPDVKKYFRKILNTAGWGLIWMIAVVTAGIYYGLAIPGDKPVIQNIIFYAVALLTLLILIRYLYRAWK